MRVARNVVQKVLSANPARDFSTFRPNCTHNQTCCGRCILCGRKISLAEVFRQSRRKEISR
jgi:hypothetical protein